jgi:hypothetical protein
VSGDEEIELADHLTASLQVSSQYAESLRGFGPERDDVNGAKQIVQIAPFLRRITGSSETVMQLRGGY